MSTNWFYPNSITQIAEDEHHVSWAGESTGFYPLKSNVYEFVGTVRPLLHVANSMVNDLRMKTYFLYLTQFNMKNLPQTISGVEAEVNMKRGGRITDDTVQLRYQNEYIGDNKATATLENIKIFGGETELWGASLSPTILTDSSFGIGIRFQSHPYWPHKETPMINYVRLRVW